MTSTANNNNNTNTSTSSTSSLNHRNINARHNRLSSPLDGLFRHSLSNNHPYSELPQDLSQYSIIKGTNELDAHTNKFQEPYKSFSPSTDTLSAKAREIIGSTTSIQHHAKLLRNSNPSPINFANPRHPPSHDHKQKSITPPPGQQLQNHSLYNAKRPSSTNLTHLSSAKETSPTKTSNLKKTLSTQASNRNNTDLYDLDQIFEEMTQIKPFIKKFVDETKTKTHKNHLATSIQQNDKFINSKNSNNMKKSPKDNYMSKKLNESDFQLTEDENDEMGNKPHARPQIKKNEIPSNKSAQISAPTKIPYKTDENSIKAIRDLFSENESENEPVQAQQQISQSNSNPPQPPIAKNDGLSSSSDESSSSSSSSSSDDDSSSSDSSSSDDDDSSSSSSSSSSSDEESSASSVESLNKPKNLDLLNNDYKPRIIKFPNNIITNQKHLLINKNPINPAKPIQKITPELKIVNEPKPLVNNNNNLIPTITPPPIVPTVKNDGNDGDNEEDHEEHQEEEEDSNNITLENIIENINSPNKKSSSKTTSPILPSTPDSSSNPKQDQSLPQKTSSESSSITFTLSDDEISDDSNASNQNVKNYSFPTSFTTINQQQEQQEQHEEQQQSEPEKINLVETNSENVDSEKSDLNNNKSLNLSSNLDDTLLNESAEDLPFSEKSRPSLTLESKKIISPNASPSPTTTTNPPPPLSAGFVPSEMNAPKFPNLIEDNNNTSKSDKTDKELNDKDLKDENDEEVKNIFSSENKKKRILEHANEKCVPIESKTIVEDVNLNKKIKNEEKTNEMMAEKKISEKLSDKMLVDTSDELLMEKLELEKEEQLRILKKIASADLKKIRANSPFSNQIINQVNLDENALNLTPVNNSANTPAAAASNVADQIQYSADGRPKLIVSIELDLIKILNLNLPQQDQAAIEQPVPPVTQVQEEKKDKKSSSSSSREKSRDKTREDSREKSSEKSNDKSREKSRERDRDSPSKRSSSRSKDDYYKDYKRNSVSSSSSSKNSDYSKDSKSSRDRDKSSRSETKDSKSKSSSSSSSSQKSSKSEFDSKEAPKRESLSSSSSSSYKSTSNGQSFKRTSIQNDDQELSNTSSKKQKLSSDPSLSTSSLSSSVNKSSNSSKTQNVNNNNNSNSNSKQSSSASPVSKPDDSKSKKDLNADSSKSSSIKSNQTTAAAAGVVPATTLPVVNSAPEIKSKNSSSISRNLSQNEKVDRNNPTNFNKNLDFLNSSIDEQVLHQRGKQKKHEADHEKDKIKKTVAYMEAVCYFCLCAIAQYRLKKTSSSSSSSNKSSFELLKDTYELLKYLNEKLVRPIDNEVFIKKFRVLSNWMEAFINRWLWLMSLKELNLIREALKDHYGKQAIAMSQASQSNSNNAQTNNNNNSSSSSSGNVKTTSPNEIPPPSPASSIGSSGGPVQSSTQQSQSQDSNPSSNTNQSQSQPQIGISTQKLMAFHERYFKVTEYNMRSQNFWDTNEIQINDFKYLTDFRDIIKQQIQRDLHIDSEAELFAAYIITGLQLFKLNNF